MQEQNVSSNIISKNQTNCEDIDSEKAEETDDGQCKRQFFWQGMRKGLIQKYEE